MDLEFRQRLYGVKRDPDRWRVCLHTLNTYLPMVTGRVYVDKRIHRSDEALARHARRLGHSSGPCGCARPCASMRA